MDNSYSEERTQNNQRNTDILNKLRRKLKDRTSVSTPGTSNRKLKYYYEEPDRKDEHTYRRRSRRSGSDGRRDSDDYDVDENNLPLHYLTRNKRKCNQYDPGTLFQIQILYILATSVWVVLIFGLQFYLSGPVGWFFLMVPLIIFGISLSSLSKHTTEVEGEMFQTNFISFGYLIVLFLINWEKVIFKKRLLNILVVALILILFSIYDVWVPKKKIILEKHVRSILQTMALSLLAYALYIYYEGIIYYDDIDGKNK